MDENALLFVTVAISSMFSILNTGVHMLSKSAFISLEASTVLNSASIPSSENSSSSVLNVVRLFRLTIIASTVSMSLSISCKTSVFALFVIAAIAATAVMVDTTPFFLPLYP